MEKMRIAILKFKGEKISEKITNNITNIIRNELISTKMFTVLERERVGYILEEMGMSLNSCTDRSCAVRIGQILSANKVLIGEINRVGKSFIITVRIVDVQKDVSEYAAKGNAQSIDHIDEACEKIIVQLVKEIVKKNSDFFMIKTLSGYYYRGSFPGLGQFYVEKTNKGYLFLSTFLLASVYSAYSLFDYYNKRDAYKKQKPPQSKIDKKYNAYKNAADNISYALSILGTVYIINWIDILFYSKPDFFKKIISENNSIKNNNSYFNIVINSPDDPLYGMRFNLLFGIRF